MKGLELKRLQGWGLVFSLRSVGVAGTSCCHAIGSLSRAPSTCLGGIPFSSLKGLFLGLIVGEPKARSPILVRGEIDV